MRGKHKGAIGAQSTCRNIPAYAGKTLGAPRERGYGLEHPRVCGENSTGRNLRAQFAGTSPRMRGKLEAAGESFHAGRNIPAYAGKTDES